MILRNLLNFYAQSLQTLWRASQNQESDIINNDMRVLTKLSIVNLDVVMANSLPFNKFRQFIKLK